MSVNIEAIVKHNLTVEQIVALPDALSKSTYDDFKGDWNWYYPDTNATFIKWLWGLSLDSYLQQPAAATLSAFISYESYIISFANEDTICFSGLKDVLFERNPTLRKQFQTLSERLFNLINGKEMFYVSDYWVDRYCANKYSSDIDSFDNFKIYLQVNNYHFYSDLVSV